MTVYIKEETTNNSILYEFNENTQNRPIFNQLNEITNSDVNILTNAQVFFTKLLLKI